MTMNRHGRLHGAVDAAVAGVRAASEWVIPMAHNECAVERKFCWVDPHTQPAGMGWGMGGRLLRLSRVSPPRCCLGIRESSQKVGQCR